MDDIERDLLEALSEPVTLRGMTTYTAGRDPLFTGAVMRHSGSWHDYGVLRVKDGKVTWRCRQCGVCDNKQVRVYGILPAEHLFVRKRAHYGQAMESVRQVA